MEPELFPTQEECARVQSELLRLLSRQTERYTMGDSSSVPLELAQELLHSVCYVLGISPDHPDRRWKELAYSDLDREYREGLERIEEKKVFCKQLWQAVSEGLPAVESLPLLRTLNSIRGFWAKYDSRFFAHQAPWDMEYPLALPLPSSLQGIDVIERYLSGLRQESCFLATYTYSDMLPILTRYCPDFRELPVNLFEPIASNALGLAVLEKPDCPPQMGGNERTALYDRFRHMDRAGILRCLEQGVSRLWKAHPAWMPELPAYLSQYCAQLAPRIDLLRDSGGLGGIFFVT